MSSKQPTGTGIFHEDGRDWTQGVDPVIVGNGDFLRGGITGGNHGGFLAGMKSRVEEMEP